ncbi:MAG: TM0996/MTH895 family glutaredoxin-like protein [candidate division Zixibacteria bacterium]|nr:TM0996/MTH895 family glutaredoxin-like protein [candidate division Zixibacteria bacterium]
MKKIEILGTGCPKCDKLKCQVDEVAAEMGLDCQVEKVSDIKKIMAYGVMMTPALVVDGVVKVTGKVPSVEELKDMLV